MNSSRFSRRRSPAQVTFVDRLEQRMLLSAASIVEWSTYLGGTADDQADAVAVDMLGNVLVTGYTKSGDLEGALNPKSRWGDEDFDSFVEKLDSSGKVIWARYLGAAARATGIAADRDGNVWITGFIPVQGPLLPDSNNTPPGTSSRVDVDVFVAKFSSSGETLWATYLGGSRGDFATSIAIGADGDAFISGDTSSFNFEGATNQFSGEGTNTFDAFVAKVGSSGSLAWATYLGGSGDDSVAGISVDSSGGVIVAGRTTSRELPRANNAHHGGEDDAFVARLGLSGELLWTTYVGSSGVDAATGVAFDSQGDVLVAGNTRNDSFSWGYDLEGVSAYVTKLSHNGTPIWTTLLSPSTTAKAVVLDYAGNAMLAGLTYSADLPSEIDASAVKNSPAAGAYDDHHTYVSKVDSSGAVVWSVFIDGDRSDELRAIALDGESSVFVAGVTWSREYLPSANNSFRGQLGSDGFVAKLSVDAIERTEFARSQALLGNADIVGTDGADAIRVSSATLDVNGENAQGVLVTINGVAGAAFVPAGRLEIFGLGGSDTIIVDPGVAFSVLVEGETGDDTITGGSGDDLLYGGAGHDLIVGGAGNDTLYGNFGADTLSGGTGDDQIFSGIGRDVINGGDGDDSLLGGNGMDQIRGGTGNDYLEGKGKADTLYGGDGNDTILGQAGSDLIYGQTGDDFIDVYDGPASTFRDTVYAGAGTDTLKRDVLDVVNEAEVLA